MPALPPAGLAVAGWRTPAGVRLDLRYAPDEAPWLDPRPATIWEDTMAGSRALGADAAGHYAVDDPYGGERGAPAVAGCFGCVLAGEQVTFAAGVTALLHALAGLVPPRALLAPALTHPDLAAWTRARGAPVGIVPPPQSAEALIAAIERRPPSVVGLDRPAFAGELLSLDELLVVAEAAAGHGAVVVVDEAAAPYLPPDASAVRLVDRLPNLVVLRGFTKAYSLGGMRVGFAVASRSVAGRVRATVPPLQVSEPALRVAVALLAAGDVCARLRARIRTVKPVVADLLMQAGLAVAPGHPDIPAVVIDDHDGAASRHLHAAGIRGLATPPGAGAERALIQLRIPIGDERVDRFAEALAGRPLPRR